MPLALLIVLVVAMFFTSVYGWTLERVAYRPLRGAPRLAPLISAIGMSIFLQNYVQIIQGARVKPMQPIIHGGITLLDRGAFVVGFSYIQILIWILTIGLMIAFALLIGRTALGAPNAPANRIRSWPRCSASMWIKVISLTFVIGAALAAVAGLMVTLYYGVVDFFIGFLAGLKAFTAAVLGGIGRCRAPFWEA